MTRGAWVRRLAVGAAAAGLLQACASTAPAPAPAAVSPPTAPPVAPPPPPPPQFLPTPGLSPHDRASKILALLDDGQRDQARADAVQLLKDEPGDRLAQSLFDQIDKDPKLLLGEKNFPYRMQPGDSFSTLAQRFLGDRFLFYALARYNGVDRPLAVEVGQTVMIPGVPGKAQGRPSHAKPGADDANPKKPAPPAPPQPAHDPARAAALRGQALAALNAGAAGRAVSLLRQAAALDPDSAAIRRDLARAERIQASVRR